jgi:tryptophan 2,3-dioxygenase
MRRAARTGVSRDASRRSFFTARVATLYVALAQHVARVAPAMTETDAQRAALADQVAGLVLGGSVAAGEARGGDGEPPRYTGRFSGVCPMGHGGGGGVPLGGRAVKGMGMAVGVPGYRAVGGGGGRDGDGDGDRDGLVAGEDGGVGKALAAGVVISPATSDSEGGGGSGSGSGGRGDRGDRGVGVRVAERSGSSVNGSGSGSGFGEAVEDPLYYPDYLGLDKLLSCQKPVSFAKGDPCHDEMLFIIIHQTYELWFKQLLFELDSVREILSELNIGEKRISLVLHRLTRIREIQKLLNEQMRVLETMSPQEFLEFRNHLFPASGFQSFQFRLLEIKLGVRPDQRLNARWIRNLSEHHQHVLRDAQAEPSLFDYVERWLRNIPFREFRGYRFQDSYREAVTRMFRVERESIERSLPQGSEREAALADLEASRGYFESVYDREAHDKLIASNRRRLGFRATSTSLMIMLYEDEPMLQLPARLLHVLVDVDEQLNQWRYRHSQIVHRMIGVKVGTGGSLGHSYLKQTIDSQKVFADLANLSTLLIPRRLLPALPSALRDQMKFFHSVEKWDRTLFEAGGGGDTIDWSFC